VTVVAPAAPPVCARFGQEFTYAAQSSADFELIIGNQQSFLRHDRSPEMRESSRAADQY
jgi:hypothetical protein